MDETEKKYRKKISRRDFLKSSAVAGAAIGTLSLGAQNAEAVPVPKKWDKTADVVIVGTGYSGLAAAIVSRQLGMSVLLLEKMPVPGGNSVIAHGGANAVDPERQKKQGIQDSTDLHFKHTMEGGDMINDPEKVRYFVDHALADAVQYLERLGVKWPEKVVRGYGALWERTHYPGTYVDKQGKNWKMGAANVRAQLDELERIGQPIELQHEVTGIVREKPLEGRVLGVEVKNKNRKMYFRAKKGAILASGGFGANIAWVTQLDRRLAETGTTNHPGATGECIKYSQDIGADTLHMDYIQAIPLNDVKPPYKATFFLIESEEVRKASISMPYRIFVNKEGKRFVDEGARRDVIKQAVLAQPPFEPLAQITADTIEELEAKCNLPKGSLVETVRKYNAACEAKKDQEFDKHSSILIPIKTGPFKANSRAMQRHHTMGGLLVKGTTGQVIDRWGKPIPGLFAAGEVTGGTHGTNRLGHNATVDCLVFGQLCARTVAKEKA
ncbi:MAG: Urocanate reductase precursor [Syntrophorhabdaceae bacterium PtaU1.Bin034]|nr:MAG: Urocanate reductase precursor [Syntrophorhabdaceae bacterium PtaU1.Bin034]